MRQIIASLYDGLAPVCCPVNDCVTIGDAKAKILRLAGIDVTALNDHAVLASSGQTLYDGITIVEVLGVSGDIMSVTLCPRLVGGKGGFGSLLRAQGGRISSTLKSNNNESCRDLNGRRLKSVRTAKQ